MGTDTPGIPIAGGVEAGLDRRPREDEAHISK